MLICNSLNIFFFILEMRTYKRKTDRGKVSVERMKEAAEEVIGHSRPCRAVAKELSICHVTLMRFVRKMKQAGATEISVGYKRNRQVFSDAEEAKLSDYIKTASSIYFGLSPFAVH